MNVRQEQSYIAKLGELNQVMNNHQVRQTERLLSNKLKADRAHSVTFSAKVNKLSKLTRNYCNILERKDSIEGKITKIRDQRIQNKSNITLINAHNNIINRNVVKKMKLEYEYSIHKEKEQERNRIIKMHEQFNRNKEEQRLKNELVREARSRSPFNPI